MPSMKKLYEGICGIILFTAVCISMSEIIARVFFHMSYDFIIDFSVWLTVWALLMMAGPLLAEGGHVSIDFFKERLGGKVRMSVELFNSLCTLLYGISITVGGALFVRQLYEKKAVFPRYFEIPIWIVELCVPISMFIFSIFAVIAFIQSLRKKW
jgi:TRAP-type C4-dicarboxylate transport system permease small subunit